MKKKTQEEEMEDDVDHDEEGSEEAEASQPEKKEKKKKSSIVALKHAQVLNAVLNGAKKNGGKYRKKSVYEAMIEQGYSPEYARQGGLKKTKAWDKLLEERLGDDKLSNIHQQLMVAKKIEYMLFNSEVTDEDIYELLEACGCIPKKIIHGIQGTHVYFFTADNRIRKDATELAYKIRGKMAPEKFEIEQGGLRALSDQELADLIKTQKKRFLKKD